MSTDPARLPNTANSVKKRDPTTMRRSIRRM
jgi:hypothetical protein